MVINKEYLKKFYRCVNEYVDTSANYRLTEVGEEDTNQNQDNQMDTPEDNNNVDNIGAEGNGMNPDNNTDGGDDFDMGGDDIEGGENVESPEGFNPDVDNNEGLEGMGGSPNTMDSEEGDAGDDDEEVIDVDDLTKSQEKAESGIDKLNSKFDHLMKNLESLIKKNKERDEKEAENEKRIADEIKKELDKRIPTPTQRLSMQTAKSAPFTVTPSEYMTKMAPDNYSPDSDNNGADDPQYKITKADIDNMTDYGNIARELDIDNQGLRNILNF